MRFSAKFKSVENDRCLRDKISSGMWRRRRRKLTECRHDDVCRIPTSLSIPRVSSRPTIRDRCTMNGPHWRSDRIKSVNVDGFRYSWWRQRLLMLRVTCARSLPRTDSADHWTSATYVVRRTRQVSRSDGNKSGTLIINCPRSTADLKLLSQAWLRSLVNDASYHSRYGNC
jgi:hypothetical protein